MVLLLKNLKKIQLIIWLEKDNFRKTSFRISKNLEIKIFWLTIFYFYGEDQKKILFSMLIK